MDSLYNKVDEMNNRISKVVAGTFSLVALFDRVIIPKMMPNFKIKSFRLVLNMGKYLVLPFFAGALTKGFFCDDVDDLFFQIAEKYNFGFEEYNYAMDMIEKADKYGKLQELLSKGPVFDWESIGGRPPIAKEVEDNYQQHAEM